MPLCWEIYGKYKQDLKKDDLLFATHYTLYLKAGGNNVAKNHKSDSTTILGAFRIYELMAKTPVVEKPEEIFVEKSLGPQTETPWFLIPSE